MDLSKLDTVAGANDGFELELQHPITNANLGLFITVLGHDSAEFKKLLGEQNRRRAAKANKGRGFKPVTAEEVEQDSTELLAACTKSWRDANGGAGKPTLTIAKPMPPIFQEPVELDCTRENAMKLYTAVPWIREQVDAAVSDRGNFLKP